MKQAYGRAFGQALVELTLFIGVLGLLLLWAIPELQQRLQQRYAAQQLLALHLKQSPIREQTELAIWGIDDYASELGLSLGDDYTLEVDTTANYAFAKGIQPLWALLDWQDEFSLPLKTLYSASLKHNSVKPNEPSWLSYLRLSDGWAPKHLQELIGRPQALTTAHYLQKIGFDNVQSLVSILPFAREFAPEQLRLGYIDPDVVPTGTLCDASGGNCR